LLNVNSGSSVGTQTKTYRESRKLSYETPPHLRLMAAIIERAVLDAIGETLSEDYREQTRAFYWIVDDSERSWSFIWLCEALDISGERIRDYVRQSQGRDNKLGPRDKFAFVRALLMYLGTSAEDNSEHDLHPQLKRKSNNG